MNRAISAQESTIIQDYSPQDEESNLESKYECPICMCILDEPILTKCGHRFCKKCITSWLKKPNSSCPVDNKPLSSESDLFPDNYTKREILQIRPNLPCPNSNYGCPASMSPLEMESHYLECQFKERKYLYGCLFKQYGCKFSAISQKDLDEHIGSESPLHLNLLMTAFTQNQIYNTEMKSLEANNKLWDPPNKNQSSNESEFRNNTDLIKGMYERIVVLEQKNREQSSQIEKLNEQIMKLTSITDVNRYSSGCIVWEITQFYNKIDAMRSNPNIMFYSNESFTSPYGYKFCARINISPKVKDFIGLHIHLIQSDNDFHLDWPFRGRIKIILIHPKDLLESQQDTIMSKPEILAFHRPINKGINPRGFGFLEYASINDILRYYVINDSITIKIQMNIV